MTVHIEENNVRLNKKYRLGHDFLFLANKIFSYKNDSIISMSIQVLFKIIDTNGHEKFFDSEQPKDITIILKNGKPSCLTNIIGCSFDRENILNFEPKINFAKECSYTLLWEIVGYTKDIDKGYADPIYISEQEFMDIMKKNIDQFDNVDNFPAQSCTHFTCEVK
ncbi:hypothetical protein P4V01_07275 [Bacillus thuringiensis]|nr:hypothetical protein [Bacillus thuringiensis]